MRIALAQISPIMGDVSKTQKKILTLCNKAKKQKADIVIYPEMALSGYHPQDMLLQKSFIKQINQSIQSLSKKIPKDITLVLGSPAGLNPISNSAYILKKNQKIQICSKQILADHNVFDEKRYFKTGTIHNNFFYLKNWRVQILICEEIWQLKDINIQKPDIILSLHASPFTIHKIQKREKLTKHLVKKYQAPFLYVNLISAEEELIFDGASFVLNAKAEKLYQAPQFKEDFKTLTIWSTKKKVKKISQIPNTMDALISAIVFGIKEFVYKNNFKKAHLGLSGGIDSAVLSYLTIKALGKKNVDLIFLPSPFTSADSVRACKELSKSLQTQVHTYPITDIYQQIIHDWPKISFKKILPLSKENLQARIRLLYLMAWSNQNPKSLLLSASNKSELSLGYSTLYGDLVGGLSPLGDLFKTEVIKLASYLKNPAIPKWIREREPSAELRHNQKDSEDIPPYNILDPILKKLIEQGESPLTTFEKNLFKQILLNEFKRKQSPPILKVKERSFDRGWRWPLSIETKFF